MTYLFVEVVSWRKSDGVPDSLTETASMHLVGYFAVSHCVEQSSSLDSVEPENIFKDLSWKYYPQVIRE